MRTLLEHGADIHARDARGRSALAVAAFRELRPALILMDINMPRLNGHHATEAIRAMTEIGGDTVPIIGVTAHVLEQLADNRLIRPQSLYTGPVGLKVVPVDQR